MKRFEYFEHTADAKFRAYGKDLEEQFANAAYATFNILIDPSTVKGVITKEFELEARRMESLLYDFLEELLFYLDVDGFLLHKVVDLKITDKKLRCVVTGDTFKNYDVGGNIKSVTYNDMKITDRYVQVVLDL